MSDSTIGIKLANGTYYPILKEGIVGRKKLVLTTVKDRQKSVQIDLYKGQGDEIQDSVYIGSLVIEDIEQAESGEPDIELVIGIDEEGNLHATANDEVTGDSQSLSVSIQTLDEQGIYEVPEFDMDFEEPADADNSKDSSEDEDDGGEVNSFTSFSSDDSYPETDVSKKRPTNLLPLLLGILVIIALVLLGFLVYRLLSGRSDPVLYSREQAQETVSTALPAEIEEPAPVVSPVGDEPAAYSEAVQVPESGPVEPVAAVPVPDKPPAADIESVSTRGIWYRIKRGDTLWDLSSSFYRNPWRYPDLVDENRIKNPDLIFAGEELYIPHPRQ